MQIEVWSFASLGNTIASAPTPLPRMQTAGLRHAICCSGDVLDAAARVFCRAPGCDRSHRVFCSFLRFSQQVPQKFIHIQKSMVVLTRSTLHIDFIVPTSRNGPSFERPNFTKVKSHSVLGFSRQATAKETDVARRCCTEMLPKPMVLFVHQFVS